MPDARKREGSESASPVRVSPKSTPRIRPTAAAAFLKLIGIPAVLFPVAVALGYRGSELVAIMALAAMVAMRAVAAPMEMLTLPVAKMNTAPVATVATTRA